MWTIIERELINIISIITWVIGKFNANTQKANCSRKLGNVNRIRIIRLRFIIKKIKRTNNYQAKETEKIKK